MSQTLSNKGVTQRNFKLPTFIKCLLNFHGTGGLDHKKMNNNRFRVVKKKEHNFAVDVEGLRIALQSKLMAKYYNNCYTTRKWLG